MQPLFKLLFNLVKSIETLGELVVHLLLFILKPFITVFLALAQGYAWLVFSVALGITKLGLYINNTVNRGIQSIGGFVLLVVNAFKNKYIAIKKSIKKRNLLFKKSLKRRPRKVSPVISKRPSFISSTYKKIFVFRTVAYAAILLIIITGVYETNILLSTVPNPQKLEDFSMPASTLIYDRNDVLLYSAYSDVNRIPIKYSEVPQSLVDATVAAEDKNFFKHSGFDIVRITKALIYNTSHDDTQGASTITQQLAKNVFLTNEKTWTRKLKEAVITWRIESNFTKEQILELYFNTISYGGDTVGIESAAQRYFGKTTAQLSQKEAVFMAALPVAPSILLYSPEKKLNYQSRIEYILNQMIEMKKITKDQKKKILAQDLTIQPTVIYKRAPNFVDYVLSELEKKYGKDYILKKGLIVKTSLDLAVQNYTQQTLLEQIMKYQVNNVNNGAVLIVNPHTGEILTMVGSVNYYDENGGQFNVVTSPRQLGSAVKLITYTTALENKYTDSTMLKDQRRYFAEFPDYIPRNYDGKEHGTVTLREAFANSYNHPALNLAYDIGLDKVAAQGVKMGITEFNIEKGKLPLSMVLGGIEMPLEHLTQAYAVIANGGKKVELDPFLEITDYDGNSIYQKKDIDGEQVVSEKTASTIFNILSDPNARMAMFGKPPQFDFLGTSVGIKTGTSNDARDNTAFAFTKDFVVGTWIGNNDNSAMTDISSGYVGATSIMHEVTMKVIETDKKRIQTKL